MIRLTAGVGLVPLVGCTPDGKPSAPPSDPACAPIPEETAGPFPGDGSNGVDVPADGRAGQCRPGIHGRTHGAGTTAAAG